MVFSLVHIYSPGRVEIGGNHTDHQHGVVLAAAVNLALTGSAEANGDNVIRVNSKGHSPNEVELSDLSVREGEKGSSNALIRGIAAWFERHDYKIGGFNAVTESSVPGGSGLSSSASFEVAVGNTLAALFGGKVTPVEIALAGQYAETRYFGKPCGLMDQVTCSVGGIVKVDLRDTDAPLIEKINFDFETAGLALCVTDTGGSHSDLTSDYAAIPREMSEVAERFGKEFMRDVSRDEFYRCLPELRGTISDRSLLRAIHFLDENETAELEAAALKENRVDDFLRLVNRSGRSSFAYLQNIYPPDNPGEQGISLALALSEQILGDKGAFRVHGGGFAGTIQAFVPLDMVERYTSEMNRVFGKCRVLSISQRGGTAAVV